jgi:hypothetical protein
LNHLFEHANNYVIEFASNKKIVMMMRKGSIKFYSAAALLLMMIFSRITTIHGKLAIHRKLG